MRLAEELITDEVPKGERETSIEELRAARITDTILKNIFGDQRLTYAVKDVRYNSENKAILVILYPAATEGLDLVIGRIQGVIGVKAVYDNKFTDELDDSEFHVLKVVVTEEVLTGDKDANADADGELPSVTGTGGSKQLALTQSYASVLKGQGSGKQA